MRPPLAFTLLVLTSLLPRIVSAGCDIQLLGELALGDRVPDVEVVEDLAYLTSGFDGLHIIDVSAPASPFVVGALDSSGFDQDVEVVDGVAYVASSSFDGPGGLRIIDVTDPTAPGELARIGPSLSRVEVADGFAYATGPWSGLRIFDVSSAANPVEVGAINLPGFENDVSVDGNLAYVAVDAPDQFSAVLIVDVSNPAVPYLSSSIYTDTRLSFDVEVAADLAYVAANGLHERGLIISDLSGPGPPVELSFLYQPSARDVRIADERVYFAIGVGERTGGLRVIDHSDRTRPVEIGRTDAAIDESSAIDVEATGDEHRVYMGVSGEKAGLRIFGVSECPEVLDSDVIPSSGSNQVPLTTSHPVPVQLLGSASRDVRDFDLDSFHFGPDGATVLLEPGFLPVFADLNSDGFEDLVVTFRSDEAGFGRNDQQGCIEGLHSGNSFIACDWVTVDLPPVAIVYALPNEAYVPDDASFRSDRSYDPEGGPLLYEWQLPDGSPPTFEEMIPARIFTEPGIYTATLTVTDQYGQTATHTGHFKAFPPEPVVPVLAPWATIGVAGLLLVSGMEGLRRRSRV